MDDDLPTTCPDCGAPVKVDIAENRDARVVRKEEVAMSYLDRPEEYAKLPDPLGTVVTPWEKTTTVTCTACAYIERNGVVTRRGLTSIGPSADAAK